MDKIYSKIRDYKDVLCIGLAVIGAGLYISLMFNNNVWMDEAFSAVIVRGNLQQVLERSAADTLPPLYNILNYIITSLFGYNTYSLRVCSVLPMIICLALSAFVIRKHFGALCSVLYSLCLMGMPQLLYYGEEIRMYALGLLFVTISGICTILILKAHFSQADKPKHKYYIFLVLATVLSGYTHHFAFVSSGLVFIPLLLFALVHKRQDYKCIRNILLCIFASLILYIPCLLTTLKQMKKVSGYFSMPDMSVKFIASCFKMPFITNCTVLSVLLMGIFAFAILYSIIQMFKRYGKDDSCLYNILALVLIDVYLDTLIFGVLATKALKSNIFTDRYLVPGLGLLWLGFSIAAADFCKKTDKALISYTATAFLLVTVIWDYSLQLKEEYRIGVDEMREYFAQNITSEDTYIIYENDYQIEICFRYYFPDFKKTELNNLHQTNGHVYYLYVPGFEQDKKEILAAFADAKLIKDFSFDRYEFTLYMLY